LKRNAAVCRNPFPAQLDLPAIAAPGAGGGNQLIVKLPNYAIQGCIGFANLGILHAQNPAFIGIKTL